MFCKQSFVFKLLCLLMFLEMYIIITTTTVKEISRVGKSRLQM